ncbi:MAG: hypothetical protein IH820_14730 [Bacteroidetes bacterium]|nr:hypothetical protein [Bacteroidota bacterium]
MKDIEMDAALTKRSVNEGFSGGEKKRNELLQMAIFEPKLRVLDEVDSGLDVDALRSVAERAKTGDEALKSAPHYAPRRRLDETQAARKPLLAWEGELAPSGRAVRSEVGGR